MQKPHWMAPDRTNASWMRWGFSGVPRPSTVMTSAPSSLATLLRQDRTALPSTITVQAPHWPFLSQDCLAPVRWSSVPQEVEQAQIGVDDDLVRRSH